MSHFFDTYAIIDLVRENQGYRKYADQKIITSLLNLGELYSAMLRDYGEDRARELREKLRGCYIDITEDIIVKAMEFRFRHKKKEFSFVDCVSFTLAKEHGLTFLTGDEDFQGMENVEFVK